MTRDEAVKKQQTLYDTLVANKSKSDTIYNADPMDGTTRLMIQNDDDDEFPLKKLTFSVLIGTSIVELLEQE